ncbi:hypothetical protein CsSME_00014361 [Camellia sinensis var. sinensis]
MCLGIQGGGEGKRHLGRTHWLQGDMRFRM